MPTPTGAISRREALIISGGVGLSLATAFLTSVSAASGAQSLDLASGSSVELTFAKSVLSGSIGKRKMKLVFPTSSAPISGTVAGEPTKVQLQTADNSSSGPVVPASLSGTLGKGPVSVVGAFTLAPSFLFESGSVSGNVGRNGIRVNVTPASGESSSSVNVSGTYGDTALSLFATVAGDLSSGLIRGYVGKMAVHLVAKQSRGAHRITGTYGGPPELLALTVGSLIYFL
jgi:hypothetical protein